MKWGDSRQSSHAICRLVPRSYCDEVPGNPLAMPWWSRFWSPTHPCRRCSWSLPGCCVTTLNQCQLQTCDAIRQNGAIPSSEQSCKQGKILPELEHWVSHMNHIGEFGLTHWNFTLHCSENPKLLGFLDVHPFIFLVFRCMDRRCWSHIFNGCC
jgi:hypothetical protein